MLCSIVFNLLKFNFQRQAANFLNITTAMVDGNKLVYTQ